MSTTKGWGPTPGCKGWSVPDPRSPDTIPFKEKILIQLSAQNTAIKNLRETVAQQSATINKLQEVILELKTMITNISG